jgi:4-hydroxy-2-oxoheptanedioate aldolase
MQPAHQLLAKVRRGEVTTGILATDHVWTDLVELSVRAGLDYLVIDLEHGAHSPDLVAEVCATGRRMNFAVLIRPRSNEYAALRLAIDLGCCGFLLASVESAAEMDIVREAVYLPPRGRRRPGGLGNRWVSDFGLDAWRGEVEDDFLVLPQIETRRGLDNLAEIVQHEMTTVLAVGPYDLSAELGVCGKMQDPVLRNALAEIQAAAKAAGKPSWMIGADGAMLVRDGWNFICLGEPSWILAAALTTQIGMAHGARVAASTPYNH